MKQILSKIILVFLLTGLTNISFAQADVNTEFTNRMNYVFGQLDKSKIPTGLLLDYAMELQPLMELCLFYPCGNFQLCLKQRIQ